MPLKENNGYRKLHLSSEHASQSRGMLFLPAASIPRRSAYFFTDCRRRKSLRFRHGDEGGVPFWSGVAGYTSDRPTPERCRVPASPIRPSERLPARNAELGARIVSRSDRCSCVSCAL